MKILAFDTAMAACSVAVIEADRDQHTVLAEHQKRARAGMQRCSCR